jgi:hypothetical protein
MIFDKTLLLSEKQAITVTAPSTNVIDLLAAGTAPRHAAPLKRNLGIGAMIPFLIQVTEDFAAAGAATLTVALQVDDNEAFSSPTTVWTSGAIALADLKAGENLGVVNYVPKGVNGKGVTERYFRLNYTVATGPMTAGRIQAGVVAAVQTNPL